MLRRIPSLAALLLSAAILAARPASDACATEKHDESDSWPPDFGDIIAGGQALNGNIPLASAGSSVNGDSTISGDVGGYPLLIQTASRLAGAIGSLTWNGMEFINSYDHGRELQSAAVFDGLEECFNPTEAGSRDDGTGPSSTSVLQQMTVSGNRLSTRTQMAFWLGPQEPSRLCPHGAANATFLSNYVLSKEVQIGFAGMPNVIEYDATFTVPDGHASARFEAVTGYMPPQFSQFWTYDPASRQLAALSVGPGEQPLPLVFSTPDGSHAMGVYSPQNEPGLRYGRLSHTAINPPEAATVKWNCVFHRGPTAPGQYDFRCYVIVGTLQDVLGSMRQIDALSTPTPRSR